MKKHTKKLLHIILILVLILNLCACDGLSELVSGYMGGAEPFVSDGTLTVRYLYVGQADCTLITLPDGKTLLIDGGNDGDGKGIAKYIKGLGIEKLDFVVGTHPHEDHIGGLDKIINEIPCGKIYAPDVPKSAQPDTANYKDFVKAAMNQECRITNIEKGESIYESGDIRIDCFSPDSADIYSDLNNYSIVLKITYGNTSFLMMGDAEHEIETLLEKSGADISADVIKAGHHGSATSSRKSFVKKVAPDYAIISCGIDNTYDFPKKKTMEVFESLGIETFVLSETGTVFAISDGNTVTMQEHKEINLDSAR